jgi:serine O-acetyltransferase
VLAHRIAHALHSTGVPFLPRLIAAIARSVTGIEIHPAARIGAGMFIDHGMGVVIGETAELGDDVTLYQGVTLGGTGFATGKRHPTVEDNVTIGSGAKLLGPITVGHGSKIGANSVVIHDVPPNSTVVGNPGHPVRIEGRRPEGPDADWVHLPDPIADAIKGLAGRITALERAGDGDGNDVDAQVRPLRPEATSGPPADAGARASNGPNRAVGPNPAGG